jgi:hypothetical protein
MIEELSTRGNSPHPLHKKHLVVDEKTIGCNNKAGIRVQLTSRWLRPGTLLNILLITGQPPPPKQISSGLQFE